MGIIFNCSTTMLREKKAFIFSIYQTQTSPAFIEPDAQDTTSTRLAVPAYNVQDAISGLVSAHMYDDNFLGFKLKEVVDLLPSKDD